jgi:hypothetical protein
LDRRLGGTQESVWKQRIEEKFFASTGDRTSVTRSSSLQSKNNSIQIMGYVRHAALMGEVTA